MAWENQPQVDAQTEQQDVIAALVVVTYPRRAIAHGMLRLVLDRFRLRRTPGLGFFRLLGSAASTAGGWNPHRYGLFTVWDSVDALERWQDSSPVMASYGRDAAEVWTVRLRPVRSHGRWGGVDPFEGVSAGEAGHGPVAILTRARVKVSAIRPFTRASRPVTRDLEGWPGLITALGMGEVPLVLQMTFSVWEGLSQAMAFAYQTAEHREAIRRTRTDGWYHEELFARFTVADSSGSLNGRDPLRGT